MNPILMAILAVTGIGIICAVILSVASKVMAVEEDERFPVVRECLKQAQRRLGAQSPLVAEGRDMGTEVFPTARYKFFLDADPEVRAARRCADLRDKGVAADLATVAAQIRERDQLDRNRAVAPLRPASDAQLVDTSARTIEEVLDVLLHAVNPDTARR